MNRYMLIASLGTLSLAVPAIADDLNPQPEPPGVHRVSTTSHLTTSTIGSATGGAGAGKVSVQDSSHTCATTTIGSATGGAGAGRNCANGQHMHMMRKAGGEQTSIGSATAGAGSGK